MLTPISLIKKIKNKVFGIVLFARRLSPHFFYALKYRPSLWLSSNYHLRMKLHALEKAKSTSLFDPQRAKHLIGSIQSFLTNHRDIDDYNLKLACRLGLTTEDKFPPLADDSKAYQIISSLPSVRNFTSQAPPLDILKNCINSANHYPKSCSRDSIHSYLIYGKTGPEALKYFSGGTCFEGSGYKLVIITYDMTAYNPYSEVFSGSIDAAIFGTGLAISCQNLGLASCMLNWSSYSFSDEKKIRKDFSIPCHHVISFGIAIGYPSSNRYQAPRKVPRDILFVR